MFDPADLFRELTIAFNQRAWPAAQALAARLISIAPPHPTVHYIAGVASMEMRQLQSAVSHLHRASELAPDRADVLSQLAKSLALANRLPEARGAADRAIELSSGNPGVFDTLGVIYSQLNAQNEATVAFRRAVALDPATPSYRFNLATALLATGEIDAAEIQLEACIGMSPCHWKAHLALAQQRKQSAASNHVERLRSLLQAHGSDPEAQTYLHMALAKEEEDCGNYVSAFSHYTRGKYAAGARRNYHPAEDEKLFEAIMQQSFATNGSIEGCESAEPVFVMGMPRSGTTLVDRILSNHAEVHSAGELLNFGITLKRLSGSHSPMLLDAETIQRAGQPDWRALGEQYLSSTRPATGRTPRFIDKLPHNFLYAGWIARALPNAKIICLRRDPLDTCLSNFRQLFAWQSPHFGYSFNLLDTGRYYALFDRLMAHWSTILSGRILEVRYEDLVSNQEAVTRLMLDFCGLAWDEHCLQFERNAAPVNTASLVQVRSPIYRGAIGRWRRYGPQLTELRTVLEGAGVRLPSTP